MKQARDGYKMTELGEIPVEWELRELQDVMQKGGSGVKRGPFGGALKKEFFVADGFAVYEQQHVIYNRFNNIRYFITSEKFDELSGFEVLPEDILISCSGTVGKVSIVPKRIKRGVMNQALLRFRPEKNLADHTFLYFLLMSEDVQSRMLDMTHGSTIKNMVAVSEIKGLKIGLPSLKEQQKIAEILSTVDEQIENTEQLIEKTKELKKGLMQQLLTKGIGHTEFKQTKLGEIPVEWEVKAINEVSVFCSNGFVGTATPFYTEKSDGVLYLQSNNIRKNRLDLTKTVYINSEFTEKYTRAKVKSNDLLTVQSGHIGSTAVVTEQFDGVYCHALIITRLNESIVDPNYLAYYLNSDIGMKWLSNIFVGSTIKHINVKDFVKFSVPIPNLSEQQKIASILLSVDKQIESYEQEKEKYLELKKGLMQQLLTGQIRVTV
ncbi:restriction endonuclease subunit S [Paenibacillus urinalis]|uniref:Restriction endonuclease subunit S n=1 Tax=Paenibacillus urinalis TaxID=521520 RepID=A0AAX3N266_9BACL|nr:MULTISPECIES: restriction endonuclease subunit S [Paenibacillus]WDH83446.1 restriction endonuclease subunit S [Paenibacillus urinalis]WDH99492.1 restriction endonuclease subunit S [Paenibacillus urinalis]WDI03125.1 restriction endonuclease subunit S [Paenibacillus urinalis]GAK41828.1 restriction endonuclease [Paenibacillus sp. TCA20]